MLSYWCCIAYMVRVKFPSREENNNHKFKDLILTLLGFIFRFIYSKKGGGRTQVLMKGKFPILTRDLPCYLFS